MNDGAMSSSIDPTQWQTLLDRGRVRGSVTQEEVCEVLALDVDTFDADLAWLR